MATVEEVVIEPAGENGGEFVGRSIVQDEKHSLYGLPHYIEGQKLHPGIQREFIGTFEGSDYLQSIQDSPRARQYEWLMVEQRKGGRVHGSPKTIHLRSRVETFDLGAGEPEAFPWIPAERPRNRARRRPVADKGGGLLRQLIDQQREEYRAALAREQAHHQELVERERRYAEERRSLERRLEEERFKRLEEKISEASSRRDDEPADFNTKLLDYALKKLDRGDEEGADSLVNMLKGETQGGGGVLGIIREVVELVREHPQEAGALINTVMPGLAARVFGAPPPPPAPAPPAPQQSQQPTTPQPQPEQPAAPVTRQQLTDAQLVAGVAAALASGVIGDADPTPYAQEVRDIIEERPHLREQLEGMLAQSDEDLLSTVSMVARVSFEALGRSKPAKWVRDFRRALKCFGIGAEPAPTVDASQNGHAAAATQGGVS